MSNTITAIIVAALAALSLYTELVRVPEFNRAKERADMADGLEGRLLSTEAELKRSVEETAEIRERLAESGKAGLAFKSELDRTRKELQKTNLWLEYAEHKIQQLEDMTAGAAAHNQTHRYGPDAETAGKIATLEANLSKARAMLSDAQRRTGHFSNSGIRTSDADRRKFEQSKQEDIRAMTEYIASVESELRKYSNY